MPTTTTLAGGDSALEAVTGWLDALSIGRYRAADAMVADEQFALMLAVESYSVELYENLIVEGIGADVSANFWESFVDGVRGFTGADITEVEVVGQSSFSAYERDFARVEARSPRGDLTVIAILGPDDRWYVDLFATFGSTFAPLFNLWVDRLPPAATGPVSALARQRASLEVARDRAVGPAAEPARAALSALLDRLGP